MPASSALFDSLRHQRRLRIHPRPLSLAQVSARMSIGEGLRELFSNEQCVGASDLVSQNSGAFVLLVALFASIGPTFTAPKD